MLLWKLIKAIYKFVVTLILGLTTVGGLYFVMNSPNAPDYIKWGFAAVMSAVILVDYNRAIDK
jgi:Trk-type K+ transport system membrane component